MLWQWGAMQAMTSIKVLKTVEEKCGAEGQKLVLDSLWQVGYDIGRQITENTQVPDDMSTGEWVSFYATVINRIAYASLESALVDSEEKVSFHIDWRPHQDHYKPFDCRVQRYFVQGMIDASMDFMKSQGREKVWNVEFKSPIPAGAETCFFTMEKGGPDQKRKWGGCTRLIEEKALDLAVKRKAEKD
ncbi:hypothetical protein [Desulfatibacillum aliphaticivorans]|nr:hypothetical protein [Desulfatibacillum aliphaticivorans]